MWNFKKYPFLTITTLSIGHCFFRINSNISLIDLGSKSCDCGELVFHSMVGQYCFPKAGIERHSPIEMINIDLANIFYGSIFKISKKIYLIL